MVSHYILFSVPECFSCVDVSVWQDGLDRIQTASLEWTECWGFFFTNSKPGENKTKLSADADILIIELRMKICQ